jgi:arsenite methyltransferase
MLPRFIARQVSHPTGVFGYAMGRLMNWHNARMNAFAIQQLDERSSDRILEIGVGGGVNLPTLIEQATFVAGIDPSRTMVNRATWRFREAVAFSRAVFREGSVEAISFEAARFGKVCTVNTVYFWRSLESGLEEIQRVLNPGGRLVLGFLPKQ